MSISEKFAGLSGPKKILVIGGGAVVGFVLLRGILGKSSSGSTVSAAEYTQDLGGIGGGSSGGGSSYTPADQSTLDSLYGAIDQLTAKLTDSQEVTAGQIAELQNSVTASQNESAFSSALLSTPSIYADTLDDTQQYSNIVDSLKSAVSGGNITADQAARASTYLAGYGNNGIAQPGQAPADLNAIKADPKLLASELQRTQAVIQNRAAAGLDTTNATKWLSMLNGSAA